MDSPLYRENTSQCNFKKLNTTEVKGIWNEQIKLTTDRFFWIDSFTKQWL